MKTTLDLIEELKNNYTEIFGHAPLLWAYQDIMTDLDMALDDALGYKNRESIDSEVLSDELYQDILEGFINRWLEWASH